MDTSLVAIKIPVDNSGSELAASTDILYKQEDIPLSDEFAPLLDQAFATQSPQPDVSMEQQIDAESLALQLQSLPQGGKLLPPLQQALESTELTGADKQQLMEQIAVRLERPQPVSEPNQNEDSSLAIHPLLINIPDSQLVASAQTAIPVSMGERPLKPVATSTETTGRRLMPLVERQLVATETGDKPLPVESLANAKNTSMESALAQVQLQAPEPGRTELASLIAAFKRQNESTLKPAETLLRTDSASTLVATTASAVQSSAPTPSGLPTIMLGTPLNQGNWDQALGERIQWMAGQKLQGAQIRLNPANLGPMEVRIQVQNEQASIQFTSAHGVVREALEAALPRLRDMFDASGVELVDVDVSGQSFAEQQRSAGEGASAAWHGGAPGQDAELEILQETPLTRVLEGGRLDLFV